MYNNNYCTITIDVMRMELSLSNGVKDLETICISAVGNIIKRQGFEDNPSVVEAFERTRDSYFNNSDNDKTENLDPFLYFILELENTLDRKLSAVSNMASQFSGDPNVVAKLEREGTDLADQVNSVMGSLVPYVFATRRSFEELILDLQEDPKSGGRIERALRGLVQDRVLYSSAESGFISSEAEASHKGSIGKWIKDHFGKVDKGLVLSAGYITGVALCYITGNHLFNFKDHVAGFLDPETYQGLWLTLTGLFSALQVYCMSVNQHKVRDASNVLSVIQEEAVILAHKRPELATDISRFLERTYEVMTRPGSNEAISGHTGFESKDFATSLKGGEEIEENMRRLKRAMEDLSSSIEITKVDDFLARTLYYPVQGLLTIGGLLSTGLSFLPFPGLLAVFNKLNRDSADPRSNDQLDLKPLTLATDQVQAIRRFYQRFYSCLDNGLADPLFGSVDSIILYRDLDTIGGQTRFSLARGLLDSLISSAESTPKEYLDDVLTQLGELQASAESTDVYQYKSFCSDSDRENKLLDKLKADERYIDIGQFYLFKSGRGEEVRVRKTTYPNNATEYLLEVQTFDSGKKTKSSCEIGYDIYQVLVSSFYRTRVIRSNFMAGTLDSIPEEWRMYFESSGNEFPFQIIEKRRYFVQEGDVEVTADVFIDGERNSPALYEITVRVECQQTPFESDNKLRRISGSMTNSTLAASSNIVEAVLSAHGGE